MPKGLEFCYQDLWFKENRISKVKDWTASYTSPMAVFISKDFEVMNYAISAYVGALLPEGDY
jgi:hypothetical protein